ncbi:MAG: tetratricopeptide repeat protein [Betaproteobacteria bacterium]|nr:tetratricopeptide repeat protein [Betaproteobacteria bacterium]
MKQWTVIFLFALSGVAVAQNDLGVLGCGELKNAFGPLDYRVTPQDTRDLVDNAHFTPSVESLIKGNTSVTAGPDIDYTLRAYPNHPRALLAMMNLSFKEKTTKPRGSHYSVECWFDRAERFRPDDGVVQMLYGIYLLKLGRTSEAVKKFEAAEATADGDPNLYYNLGLAYFDLKKYDRALDYAHKAYALNFPLPGLRDKLKRMHAWKDLPPPPQNSAPQNNDSQGVGSIQRVEKTQSDTLQNNNDSPHENP